MVRRGPPERRSPAELLAFGVIDLDKPPGPSSHQVSAWLRDRISAALTEAARDGAADEGPAGDRAADEGPADGVGTGAGTDDAGTDAMSENNGGAVDDAGRATLDRAAHAGTLDPKVTGCLPVMLGDATRLAPVFLEGVKEYVAVLECHAPVPTDVDAVADEFEGPIYQKPPRKSAVARRLRVREIHELAVLETTDRRALLRIRCESGTYVRKLCHDLGLALGTGAHMGDLRRTATTPFDDAGLSTLEDVYDALAFWLEDGDPEPIREVVAPAERALDHLPSITIAPSAADQVANGAPVYAPGVLAVEAGDAGVDPLESGGRGTDAGTETDADEPPLVACFTPDGAAVCLGRLVGDPDADDGTVVDLERVLV